MDKRFNVIGIPISLTNWQEALDSVIQRLESKQGGYACFSNVHVCVMAHNNTHLLKVLSNSFRTFPDGKPLAWVGEKRYGDKVSQVAGPDFFPALLSIDGKRNYRHYFYGSQPEILQQLVTNIEHKYPHAKIVGHESPPFCELTEKELDEALQRIKNTKPDFIWVGLGAPKQEYWMSKHWRELAPAILFGVGAAFDFHAGTVQRAPRWARHFGLEWLHRLLQEPGRLWKRYFYTNSMFLFYLLKDALFKE